MSKEEIKRAIIEVQAAQKKDRRITVADGTQLSKEWVRIETLELAERLLRAELSRQENAPLTCDGCEFDMRGNIVMAYARCERCSRQDRSWMSDRYITNREEKQKGEKE